MKSLFRALKRAQKRSQILAQILVPKGNILAFAVICAGLLWAPSSALACRDCPFPMHVGDNKWLMPDNSFFITIFETQLNSKNYSVSVRLSEPSTGVTIASGATTRTFDQRWIIIPMFDRHGHKITGRIRWVNYEHTEVQVKFECETGKDCDLN